MGRESPESPPARRLLRHRCPLSRRASSDLAVIDHQAAVLHDEDSGARERLRRPIVSNPALQPHRTRLFGEQVLEVAGDVARPAEDVDDVDLARHVDHLPIDLLAEDLDRFRVVDGYRHDLEPHLLQRLRHVVRGLPAGDLGLDAEHRHATRLAQEAEQALLVVLDQIALPVVHSSEHILRRSRRPPRSVVEAALMAHTVTAARGTVLSCKGWVQEAALRMLCNNLDPEVAEKPDELIVYGGSGKAARDWPSFDRICATLKTLSDDETLLVQSGKPVGVLRTHPDAPRVLIANSNLVPKWATWEKFRELEKAGLMMYGQMTAGSWIYIGTQGILQGTYETFAAAGRQHFGTDDLAGRLIVSAGLGGMGGAQPLAAVMCGATFLGIEVDPARARRRVEQGYLDELAPSLDAALLAVARCAA